MTPAGSRRCSTPLNAAAAARIPSGVDPERERDGDRGQRVGDVVGARDGELGDRHDPAGDRGVADAAAIRRRRARAARRRRPRSSRRRPRAHRVAACRAGSGSTRAVPSSPYEATTGSSSLSTSAPSGSTSSASRRLTAPVRLERSVPVEVVRGDVGVDGHGRAAGQGRQLELGQLVDDAMRRGQLEQPFDDRDPDVAAEHDRVSRIGGQQGRGQRRRRGLALGAGHPDGRRRAEAQEQVRLGDERRNGRVAAGPRLDQRPQGGPQPRLGRREVGRDRWRGGDQIGRRPGRSRVHVRPERQGHRPLAQRGDRVGEGRGRAAVVDRHPRAGVGQEAGQREAAAGQPEHRHRPVAQGAGSDRVEVEAVEVDRSAGRHRHHCSRSSEARKSVTPSSAARIPTIQKRTVIFSSSQPPSSKW